MQLVSRRAVVEEAAQLSLKVQPKSHNDNMPLSQCVIDQLAALDIKVHFDSATVLGSPVATNDTVLHRSLRSSVESLIESIKICMQDQYVSANSHPPLNLYPQD
jgi:hypothetical protein